MAFDPRKFLALAKDLYTEGSRTGDEARLRSAVSRAYYSAFLLLREAIRTERSAPRLHIEHERLARDLKVATSDLDVQEIGQRLDGLRSARGDADYKMGERPTPMKVGLMVNDAEWISQRMGAVGPTRISTRYTG